MNVEEEINQIKTRLSGLEKKINENDIGNCLEQSNETKMAKMSVKLSQNIRKFKTTSTHKGKSKQKNVSSDDDKPTAMKFKDDNNNNHIQDIRYRYKPRSRSVDPCDSIGSRYQMIFLSNNLFSQIFAIENGKKVPFENSKMRNRFPKEWHKEFYGVIVRCYINSICLK